MGFNLIFLCFLFLFEITIPKLYFFQLHGSGTSFSVFCDVFEHTIAYFLRFPIFVHFPISFDSSDTYLNNCDLAAKQK